MVSLITLLLSDPDDSSLRRSSPVERCVNPYFSTSFPHCVPLPEPGPPRKEVTYQTSTPSLVPQFWRWSPGEQASALHSQCVHRVLDLLGAAGTTGNGVQSLPLKSLLSMDGRQVLQADHKPLLQVGQRGRGPAARGAQPCSLRCTWETFPGELNLLTGKVLPTGPDAQCVLNMLVVNFGNKLFSFSNHHEPTEELEVSRVQSTF